MPANEITSRQNSPSHSLNKQYNLKKKTFHTRSFFCKFTPFLCSPSFFTSNLDHRHTKFTQLHKPKQAQLISTPLTVKNNNRTQQTTQQSFTTMRNQPNLVKRNGVFELSNPRIQRRTQSWLNTLQ